MSRPPTDPGGDLDALPDGALLGADGGRHSPGSDASDPADRQPTSIPPFSQLGTSASDHAWIGALEEAINLQGDGFDTKVDLRGPVAFLHLLVQVTIGATGLPHSVSTAIKAHCASFPASSPVTTHLVVDAESHDAAVRLSRMANELALQLGLEAAATVCAPPSKVVQPVCLIRAYSTAASRAASAAVAASASSASASPSSAPGASASATAAASAPSSSPSSGSSTKPGKKGKGTPSSTTSASPKITVNKPPVRDPPPAPGAGWVPSLLSRGVTKGYFLPWGSHAQLKHSASDAPYLVVVCPVTAVNDAVTWLRGMDVAHARISPPQLYTVCIGADGINAAVPLASAFVSPDALPAGVLSMTPPSCGTFSHAESVDRTDEEVRAVGKGARRYRAVWQVSVWLTDTAATQDDAANIALSVVHDPRGRGAFVIPPTATPAVASFAPAAPSGATARVIDARMIELVRRAAAAPIGVDPDDPMRPVRAISHPGVAAGCAAAAATAAPVAPSPEGAATAAAAGATAAASPPPPPPPPPTTTATGPGAAGNGVASAAGAGSSAPAAAAAGAAATAAAAASADLPLPPDAAATADIAPAVAAAMVAKAMCECFMITTSPTRPSRTIHPIRVTGASIPASPSTLPPLPPSVAREILALGLARGEHAHLRDCEFRVAADGRPDPRDWDVFAAGHGQEAVALAYAVRHAVVQQAGRWARDLPAACPPVLQASDISVAGALPMHDRARRNTCLAYAVRAATIFDHLANSDYAVREGASFHKSMTGKDASVADSPSYIQSFARGAGCGVGVVRQGKRNRDHGVFVGMAGAADRLVPLLVIDSDGKHITSSGRFVRPSQLPVHLDWATGARSVASGGRHSDILSGIALAGRTESTPINDPHVVGTFSSLAEAQQALQHVPGDLRRHYVIVPTHELIPLSTFALPSPLPDTLRASAIQPAEFPATRNRPSGPTERRWYYVAQGVLPNGSTAGPIQSWAEAEKCVKGVPGGVPWGAPSKVAAQAIDDILRARDPDTRRRIIARCPSAAIGALLNYLRARHCSLAAPSPTVVYAVGPAGRLVAPLGREAVATAMRAMRTGTTTSETPALPSSSAATIAATNRYAPGCTGDARHPCDGIPQPGVGAGGQYCDACIAAADARATATRAARTGGGGGAGSAPREAGSSAGEGGAGTASPPVDAASGGLPTRVHAAGKSVASRPRNPSIAADAAAPATVLSSDTTTHTAATEVGTHTGAVTLVGDRIRPPPSITAHAIAAAQAAAAHAGGGQRGRRRAEVHTVGADGPTMSRDVAVASRTRRVTGISGGVISGSVHVTAARQEARRPAGPCAIDERLRPRAATSSYTARARTPHLPLSAYPIASSRTALARTLLVAVGRYPTHEAVTQLLTAAASLRMHHGPVYQQARELCPIPGAVLLIHAWAMIVELNAGDEEIAFLLLYPMQRAVLIGPRPPTEMRRDCYALAVTNVQGDLDAGSVQVMVAGTYRSIDSLGVFAAYVPLVLLATAQPTADRLRIPPDFNSSDDDVSATDDESDAGGDEEDDDEDGERGSDSDSDYSPPPGATASPSRDDPSSSVASRVVKATTGTGVATPPTDLVTRQGRDRGGDVAPIALHLPSSSLVSRSGKRRRGTPAAGGGSKARRGIGATSVPGVDERVGDARTPPPLARLPLLLPSAPGAR